MDDEVMTVAGVVVNGRVEFTEPHSFPEGALVLVELDEEGEFYRRKRKEFREARVSGEIAADKSFASFIGLPGADETHEEFLQSLRDSIAGIRAGERTYTLEEVFAHLKGERELEAELDELPAQSIAIPADHL